MFDWSVVWGALPSLWEGTKMTLYITVLGLLGGVVLGCLTGVITTYVKGPMKLSTLPIQVLASVARAYVLVIRGTPIVVQVMFIYFALPSLMDMRIDGESAAVFTLMVNSGAYIAEIVRGALQSVPKGLQEAGEAMGLPFYKILIYIIAPVAWRRMIPAMGNQCIISLKDSSLFIVIGVAELTRKGQEIIAGNFRSVEIWGSVAIIYLILTSVIALILRTVERRLRVV